MVSGAPTSEAPTDCADRWIQNSLPLALVTHNPVMMILNLYTISFVCYKYNLPLLSLPTVLLAFTMYFPSLIWEVCRKIRAPKDETEYVTYSKLFGYKKATRFIEVVTLLDILTNFVLLWNISHVGVVVLVRSSDLIFKINERVQSVARNIFDFIFMMNQVRQFSRGGQNWSRYPAASRPR